MRDGHSLSGIVWPPLSRHNEPVAPTAIGTFAFVDENDPGKGRPANALVPTEPGKAVGGSSHAPPASSAELR
jgi:hypothetical protein